MCYTSHMLCSAKICFLTVFVNIMGVNGYADMRGIPCVNPDLLDALPKDRVVWHGNAEIELECEEGYDFPVNAPAVPNVLFNCLPGGYWEPAIFYDCNKEIVPYSITTYFVATIPNHMKCSDFTKRSGLYNTAVFYSKHKGEIKINVCGKLNSTSCRYLGHRVVCHVEDIAPAVKRKGQTKPHLEITVKTVYKNGDAVPILKEMYKLEDKLNLTLFDHDFGKNATRTVVKASCAKGNIGILAANGRIRCRGCSLGHYLDDDEMCALCKPGYYNDKPHATECQLCPALMAHSNDTELMKLVDDTVKDGAFRISQCPVVKMGADGNLVIVKELNERKHDRPLESASTNDGHVKMPFASKNFGTVVTVYLFVVAGLRYVRAS